MPQINRIRVNNVKYNFGTQFYDDFVMRFSCKNTIYDLANGGGKSVLMLLLLQNLIPNCTLDDKQPIEKLFREKTGSTTIHSLIEWKLDPCYMKDNFKYMTTGFCARRGKENENDADSPKETANIEYFNYCIFYREFGDNDIRNLPLSNGKERITYQGLRNYLKDLEKKDFGVSVKIFDRKNEYQQFLTSYGIFESQWEIVRGINKTEGHVRTYFESNYKTSRKVVEDLLIEQIIEKSFMNRIGANGTENDMAKTLLDIKDKLVELSKRKETLDNYDKQIEAMEEFAQKLENFKDLYDKKENLKNSLISSLLSIRSLLAKKEEAVERLEENKEKLIGAKLEINRDIAMGNIIEDEATLLELKQYLEECENKLAKLQEKQQEYADALKYKEVAMHYAEYLEYKYKKEEIKETIDNRLRDFSDIQAELNTLAGALKEVIDEEIKALEKDLSEAETSYEKKDVLRKELMAFIRECDRNIAVNAKLISENEARQNEVLEELRVHMQKVSILVAEDANELYNNGKKNLSDAVHEKDRLEKLIKELNEKIADSVARLNSGEFQKEFLKKEIQQKTALYQELDEKEEKLERLYDVYGESKPEILVNKLESMIKTGVYELSEIENNIGRLKLLKSKIENGEYAFDEPQYKEIKEYLLEHYGEDVVTGDVWLKKQPKATQRDLLKRIPFITHAIVIKEDFERIKEDINLRNISNGAYAIPIVGEGVLYETRNAITSDHIIFAYKDISFLADEDKVKLEISKIDEELSLLNLRYEKLRDRAEVIRDDFSFVLEYTKNDSRKKADLENQLKELEEKLELMSREEATLNSNLAVYKERYSSLTADYEVAVQLVKEWEMSLGEYDAILKKRHELEKLEADVVSYKEALRKNEKDYERVSNDIAECEEEILNLKNEKINLDEKLKGIKLQWNTVYEPYYVPEVKHAQGFSREELRAKFAGLKAVIDKEAVDVTDKETLYAAYDNACQKEISEIEYLGVTFEEAKVLYESGKITYNDRQELFAIKENKKEADKKQSGMLSDIQAQSALVNRTEGSIAHAKKEIVDRYGELIYPEVSNVALYKEEKKNALKNVDEEIKKAEADIKQEKEKYTKSFIIHKDLERIVKNAGIEVNQDVVLKDGDVAFDEAAYESDATEFDKLVKEESKRKEEFLKNRQKLKETLEKLGAYELAFAVNESVSIPKDGNEVSELITNINETNRCIALERDRVGKGIEDMEKIKDSFENRCLQTCDNIKSELERLPKLSKITLDDEVISIISLGIPYVKPEFTKERMSSYIQEVIVGSESYKNQEERLKYIRSKLTWKKLFSVIVTDMNGIKLNLYKRERIGGQSRYLKYEEAVGSTGQSQGIYIQFLIAIINYISSINAAGKAEGVVGKTIFIDNPFGAAKDTYIWEPIFKLLKTNHVQLIVPARGTTPAIVGKFEVNYILGQKLVNGMQQTVIVDYRSETGGENLEYERLEFSQNTFDFESMLM